MTTFKHGENPVPADRVATMVDRLWGLGSPGGARRERPRRL
jgi:hypothetical protein